MSNDTSKTSDPGFVKPSVTGKPTLIPPEQRTEPFDGPEIAGPPFDQESSPLDEPNRFDPFEALDKINLLVSDVLDHQHAGDPWKILGHTDALRAYITGMER